MSNPSPSNRRPRAPGRSGGSPEPSWIARLREMPDGIIASREHAARRILVRKTGSELQLLFDSVDSCEIQSRLDLDRPLDLRSPYTRALMLGLLWTGTPRRVHVIGLGGARIPMVLRHHFPGTVIDCTEADPYVTEFAIRFFGLQIDSRLRVFQEDGRGFLERRDRSGVADKDPYDLIVVDAFEGAGFGAARLATSEFLACCRRQLDRDGVLAVNLLPGDPLLDRKLATLGAAFSDVWLHEHDGVVAFGRAGETPGRDELLRRARTLQDERRFAFGFRSLARSLRPLPSMYRGTGPWTELFDAGDAARGNAGE